MNKQQILSVFDNVHNSDSKSVKDEKNDSTTITADDSNDDTMSEEDALQQDVEEDDHDPLCPEKRASKNSSKKARTRRKLRRQIKWWKKMKRTKAKEKPKRRHADKRTKSNPVLVNQMINSQLTFPDSNSKYRITKGCATTKGKIRNIEGILTIDTEAGITIISYNYWKLIGANSDSIDPYFGADVVGPEGSSVEPVGWVEAEITVAGQTIYHPSILTKKFNQLVLLGADFLHKAGIVLDIRGGRLWRKSRPTEKYLLFMELYQAGRLDVPVYAAEKRIIPPYHDTYLTVRVPSDFDSDQWEATTTSFPSRISTANCLVVVKNNSTALQIANLTSRRQVIHKGQRLAYLEPLASQWITPSTGILQPQSQHYAIHNPVDDHMVNSDSIILNSVNSDDKLSHNNNMYDDWNNDQHGNGNTGDIPQHHYNNTINYYQNINTNSLINDDYSTEYPNPTKHHGPVASDPTLELESLMPVINKEGLTHEKIHIDTYIDSHNSMGEVEEEGKQETEHEKEEKYTYDVVEENKESYNVSAPSSSQASESEEFREQLLRDLDLSSASLSDAEKKRLTDLVL
ncbi:unnamed protein product, partial [Didymodactylos carnosus]